MYTVVCMPVLPLTYSLKDQHESLLAFGLARDFVHLRSYPPTQFLYKSLCANCLQILSNQNTPCRSFSIVLSLFLVNHQVFRCKTKFLDLWFFITLFYPFPASHFTLCKLSRPFITASWSTAIMHSLLTLMIVLFMTLAYAEPLKLRDTTGMFFP